MRTSKLGRVSGESSIIWSLLDSTRLSQESFRKKVFFSASRPSGIISFDFVREFQGIAVMLFIGQQRERTCQTLTRRAFLQAGGSTVLGLSLTDLLRLRASAGTDANGSAKSVLLLWLWGGPSQLDTWDPKPDAPVDYRGLFSPIATRVSGIKICELFPQLAKVADTFSIIRSLQTSSNDHGVAGTIGLTGSSAGGVDLGGKPMA